MVFRIRFLILALTLSILPGGCGKNLPEPIQVTPQDQVYYSDQSQWREEAGVVIRDPAEWERYWVRLTGSEANLPTVDFSSEMLLLFNAGRRYPGDRIQILELVARAERELIAFYEIEESGTRESEVYPVQVVRVRRQRGEVRFEEKRYGPSFN
jgi:hypothetical protein